MKTKYLLALIPLMFSLHASAEDREWVSYRKFIDKLYLDKFYNAPSAERDKVRLLVKVQPANTKYKPSDLVLTVVHSGSKDRFPVNAEGFIDIVPNPEWLKEDAMIFTNLPKDEKTSVMSSMEAKVPESLQFDYGYLMASVTQWNHLIKEYAGMLRFLAPTFAGVEFQFARPEHQSVRLMTKSGPKIFTADDKGYIDLKLDDALIKENPQLVLSERPANIAMIE